MISAVRVFLKIGLVFAAVGVSAGIYAAYWDSLQNSRTAQLDATLFRAVDAGNVNAARAALQAGADVDARRFSNPRTIWEPLQRLEIRLQYPNYHFQIGYTPLMIASIRGDTPMAALLLGHGAKTEVVESDGADDPPLELAVSYNHPQVALLLLQHGANPNGTPGSYGPVYDAWLMNSPAMTRLLVSHGATPLPNALKKRPTRID